MVDAHNAVYDTMIKQTVVINQTVEWLLLLL